MTSDRTITARGALLACTLMFIVPSAGLRAQEAPAMPEAPVVLVPHRAIYDLSLAQTRGNSTVVAVRGRILYDFSGNACDGYSLTFRQLSELDNSEGKVSTSDLRSTTWEDADAKDFKFSSQNFVDQNLVDAVNGRAEHEAKKTAVDLRKPEKRKLDLAAGLVFPTEHMVRAIEAARAGKTILSFPVYDGSETGDKIFNTLTVIGRKIAPGQHEYDDAAAHNPQLANVPRWPVTISYFSANKAAQSGEQRPDYTIGFELYDNGISRALTLDYNDFVVSGKLVSLNIRQAKPCK
ncbi:MAG: cell envelope integrity EipB family protein [Xanthobacteraceae bacterium]